MLAAAPHLSVLSIHSVDKLTRKALDVVCQHLLHLEARKGERETCNGELIRSAFQELDISFCRSMEVDDTVVAKCLKSFSRLREVRNNLIGKDCILPPPPLL